MPNAAPIKAPERTPAAVSLLQVTVRPMGITAGLRTTPLIKVTRISRLGGLVVGLGLLNIEKLKSKLQLVSSQRHDQNLHMRTQPRSIFALFSYILSDQYIEK